MFSVWVVFIDSRLDTIHTSGQLANERVNEILNFAFGTPPGVYAQQFNLNGKFEETE